MGSSLQKLSKTIIYQIYPLSDSMNDFIMT